MDLKPHLHNARLSYAINECSMDFIEFFKFSEKGTADLVVGNEVLSTFAFLPDELVTPFNRDCVVTGDTGLPMLALTNVPVVLLVAINNPTTNAVFEIPLCLIGRKATAAEKRLSTFSTVLFPPGHLGHVRLTIHSKK